MTEFCPDCGAALTVEAGLWYCDQCDAYHGDIEEREPATKWPEGNA